MIDNFDLLKSFYHESPYKYDPDSFLFGQIMTRKKDTGESPRIIKDIIFNVPEDFDSKKSDIVELCNHFNARAYLNIAPKSYRKVAFRMIRECTDLIESRQESRLRSLFSKSCGNTIGPVKYWILDVDDEFNYGNVCNSTTYELEVPTVNGYHLIHKPFDPRYFKNRYPLVQIHKNNPTLLYSP